MPALAERIGELIAGGDVDHRAAERMLGYLLVQSHAGSAYPRRTRARRRRELREHGLVLVDPMADPIEVDLGEALDAALSAWSADA